MLHFFKPNLYIHKYAFKFNRLFSTSQLTAKQHLNIGTIGDESHGKTTLTQAILHTLNNNDDLHGTNTDFDVLNKDKLSQLTTSGGSRTINFEFETQKRHYLLADNTGNKEHITNMIVGSSQLECAILVISTIDGISHVAKQHLLILQHLQIPHIIVYFNKTDDEQYDSELQDLIEMEVTETLEKYNFNTDKIPFIRGSALNALENQDYNSIIDVLNELDKFEIIDEKQSDNTSSNIPFLLPIQLIHNIKGVGIAVIGKAEQGILNAGDNVELIGGVPYPINKKAIGKNLNIDGNVASLRLFDHVVKSGKKRDYLGIALHGNNVNTKTIKRGMYVVKQIKGKNENELVKGYWKFKCNIQFFESESGNLDANGISGDNDDNIGKTTPISVGYQPVFHFVTNDCSGKIEEIPNDKNGVIMPGETVDGIIVCLQHSAVIWKDLRFILREANRTIGVGVITEPIDL
eukprot:119681_1